MMSARREAGVCRDFSNSCATQFTVAAAFVDVGSLYTARMFLRLPSKLVVAAGDVPGSRFHLSGSSGSGVLKWTAGRGKSRSGTGACEPDDTGDVDGIGTGIGVGAGTGIAPLAGNCEAIGDRNVIGERGTTGEAGCGRDGRSSVADVPGGGAASESSFRAAPASARARCLRMYPRAAQMRHRMRAAVITRTPTPTAT